MKMRIELLSVITCIVWSISIAPLVARASVTTAQALFDRGIELMESGHHDEACSKLEQSLREERRPITILALADCNTKRGKITTAIRGYDQYLKIFESFSGPKRHAHEQYANDARLQRNVLLVEVAAIVLVLPPSSSVNFEAIIDGVSIGRDSLGLPFVVDPGDHVVILKVPGIAPRETRLHLEKGQSKRISVAPPSTAVGPIVPEKAYYWDPPSPVQTSNHVRNSGFVALGVGASGLVVGAVALALAVSSGNELKPNCENAASGSVTYCQTQAAVDAGNRAKTSANVATFGFGAALAGTVLGGGLLIVNRYTAEKHPKANPLDALTTRIDASVNGVAISLNGKW